MKVRLLFMSLLVCGPCLAGKQITTKKVGWQEKGRVQCAPLILEASPTTINVVSEETLIVPEVVDAPPEWRSRIADREKKKKKMSLRKKIIIGAGIGVTIGTAVYCLHRLIRDDKDDALEDQCSQEDDLFPQTSSSPVSISKPTLENVLPQGEIVLSKDLGQPWIWSRDRIPEHYPWERINPSSPSSKNPPALPQSENHSPVQKEMLSPDHYYGPTKDPHHWPQMDPLGDPEIDPYDSDLESRPFGDERYSAQQGDQWYPDRCLIPLL
jgi:hypothetical protein